MSKGARSFTPEEITKILNEFENQLRSERNTIMMKIGLHTGFRIQEILSLTVGDVYEDGVPRRDIKVERKYMKGQKASRSVIISDQLREALIGYYTHLKDVELSKPKWPLIYGQSGKPICYRQALKIIQTTCKKLGISTERLSTHSFRKTFAIDAFNLLGNDIQKVQKALGHKNLQSTTNYIPVDQGEIDEAIKTRKVGSETEKKTDVNKEAETLCIELA